VSDAARFSADDGSDRDLVNRIAAAVAQLPLASRGSRWTSLSACVIDAVWSLGSHYRGVVVPLVHRLLIPAADGDLTAIELPTADPHPLGRLLERFPDEHALLEAADNRQLTSTRNGITKAAAVLQFASILVQHGLDDLDSAGKALSDGPRVQSIDRALARVPGEGHHGIRRGYFWMLCGDDERIKPDRMVLRWLRPFGVTDPARAHQVLVDVASFLTEQAGDGHPRVTPWQVDHAIWLAARSKGKRS
jgi:hypothetical protein